MEDERRRQGGLKRQYLKRKYEAKMELPEGGGGGVGSVNSCCLGNEPTLLPCSWGGTEPGCERAAEVEPVGGGGINQKTLCWAVQGGGME